MKERPIIFSGEMVRAILDGRKTQARRVVKPQPTHRLVEGMGHVTVGMDLADDGAIWYDADCINPGREVRCPYGRVGDRLYVRESLMNTVADDNSARSVVAYKADGAAKFALAENEGEGDFCGVTGNATPWITPEHKWQPSIHMPRWASRITLEVTDVRVERVQDITEQDAIAEGFSGDWRQVLYDDGTPSRELYFAAPSEEFATLWDKLNAARGFGWDSNPWVWCVEFKRIGGAT